ncbi:MAG TPA: GNAT family N-acetyltransferase [Bryobacteraceae bacterium]|nr:GNAT family N-acetyltransferase [Bryobacteraceae bacterium]
MAALPDGPPGKYSVSPEIVDLRRLDVEQLNPILNEETACWRDELDWDFRPSAELIRRFVHMQALSGFALVSRADAARPARAPRVEGYSYFVAEETKGLIGDIYVRRDRRPPHEFAPLERALLDATLDGLWQTPGMSRVEAQLLLLKSNFSGPGFRAYSREFLDAPLDPMLKLPAKSVRGMAITHWTDGMHDLTARLIAAAYQSHIDSQINDQYRSVAGARRFLMNIVQFPGCGSFFAPASYAAIDTASKQLRGISLSSKVSEFCGHITQLCVAQSEQGTGLGYELARHSLIALRAHGCHSVSLTVTSANDNALRLYRRMGFSNRRDFSAYVWDRSA